MSSSASRDVLVSDLGGVKSFNEDRDLYREAWGSIKAQVKWLREESPDSLTEEIFGEERRWTRVFEDLGTTLTAHHKDTKDYRVDRDEDKVIDVDKIREINKEASTLRRAIEKDFHRHSKVETLDGKGSLQCPDASSGRRAVATWCTLNLLRRSLQELVDVTQKMLQASGSTAEESPATSRAAEASSRVEELGGTVSALSITDIGEPATPSGSGPSLQRDGSANLTSARAISDDTQPTGSGAQPNK
jgi:hypothetical protein